MRLDRYWALVSFGIFAFIFTMCSPNTSLMTWAEPSPPIPTTSTITEQQLKEEALYLNEETVTIASRYEQPISQAPSDVYMITDADIRNSGTTDIPTLLRQVPGLEVMRMTAVDFNVRVRGNYQRLAKNYLKIA